jgi:hypothetical protein
MNGRGCTAINLTYKNKWQTRFDPEATVFPFLVYENRLKSEDNKYKFIHLTPKNNRPNTVCIASPF